MKKHFPLLIALLATLSAAQTPADRDAARKAAEAERLPSAETLYKQHKWREAEKAFSAYASGHPRPADAAAALLRVADCREKMGDRKGSTLMLDRVARDAESLRREPDACAAAWCRLYRGAVQNSADSASRLRLLSDARSRLPAHSEILSLCEAEADAQLSAGNSSKAQELYGMAGRCLSPSGTNCLAYIHSCATLTAPPLDESDAVSLAALFHDKPSCAKPLSGILSKRRKDGWRALYALARHQAELGDADAALALWDRMLGAGQGQEDILLAAKAEQLLSTGRYSDAKETARRFLDAHAASPQANRVRQILSRAESVLARKEKERSEQEAKRKRQAENPALAELDRAERLLSAGKLAEAERLFRHTAEQEDAILRARASLGLGQVLFAKGSGQDAMKVWQTTWNRRDFAIEEEEKLFLSEVRRSMADLWMEEEGASAKASAAYGEADILHAPVGKWETTPRRTRRIVALAMSGKPGEAAELTRLLARSAPDGSMAALRWQTLAEDIAKGRLSSSSAPKLRVALSQLSLAETLYAAGDAKGALRVYQRVSAIPEARSLADHADFGAAMSLAALGKEKDAVEALLRIPRKHPQSELRPLAFLNAGTMAANPPLRDGQKARKTLAQLTAAFPKSREAEAGEFIAATIAWKEKKWAEAKKRHMDFLEAHPDSRLVSMIRETRLPAIAAHSTLPPQTAPFRLEHRVVVGPHDSKWRPYHLDFSDARDCILRIFPADGYAIASCDVDVRPFQPERPIPYKWVLMDKSATEYRFEITHAFSSLEYGFFQGKLAGRKQGGGGPGRPEVLPFDVTVPAVDIDWNEAYGWQEELDEDNTVENIPATAIPTERRTFLIREPDDSNRHRIETLQLAWDKPDALQVLRVDTGEEVTSGWTFRREDVAFPLFFQAIPKDGGWGEVTLTLEGWAGRPRPEYDEDISFDKIKGQIIGVDLDIEADDIEGITDLDDPFEVLPGGIVPAQTDQLSLLPITLHLADNTLGMLTLNADCGEDRIRLWSDENRRHEVPLPIQWSVPDVPTILFIEGIDVSQKLGDVVLTLTYENANNGIHCDDKVSLTVVDLQILNNANTLDNNGFAYINSVPEMPPLTACIVPTVLSGNANWRIRVRYRRNPRNDDNSFPAGEWRERRATEIWNITNDFRNHFVGGYAEIFCRYRSHELKKNIHIRGTNPAEADAENYLVGQPWYVAPIARHESGIQNNRTFIQFNEIGVLGVDDTADIRYCPNFGGPAGWGIMQLDTPVPTPEELWNWQANLNAGIQHLATCRQDAHNWIQSQQAQQRRENPGADISLETFTFGGMIFQTGTDHTPEDACTIVRYNGAPRWPIVWRNATPSSPGHWDTNPNGYLDAICTEYENH